MPIKIHHGPPGSFKTSGALADDFLREAKEGRVIVTNVRGLTRERVLKRFPDLPSSFDVINVDDKSREGREKWAQWFHWIPAGAFMFVDEVQDIWPRSWREADIRKLDYPGGVDQAAIDDRPKDWEQAFDKHRHWNWDMVLTTPQYAKVRDDVKGVADMAFKHKDLALIGWTGRYVEGAHAADDTGKNRSDFVNIQQKKVPPYVFDIYDSTATGNFSVTKNGISLFKNPRVLALLAIILVAGGFVISAGPPRLHAGSDILADKNGAPRSSSASQVDGVGSVASGVGAGGVGGVVDRPKSVDPLEEGDWFIVASIRVGQSWRYALRRDRTELTNNDILDMGYEIESKGSCGVIVRRNGYERFVVCRSGGSSDSGALPPPVGAIEVHPPDVLKG